MAKKFRTILIEDIPTDGYKTGKTTKFKKVTKIKNNEKCGTLIISHGDSKETHYIKKFIGKIREVKDITEKYL